ncbi:2-hydroxychromene-2-carboxylate isomerase [Palleronia sp. KMU-117]|jgi:2-hydroxychromene-2-carboxylate isomerase|uniref:2-hydroxychromene-2-carboxylate isomerase n=1 Tax=Palleronia sp. KMU-117 TaxID=3434108 RepID=UPI003D7224EA
MARIDFWFSIGSTYSYLSVMRLGQVAAETGIDFVWRPFNVRAIMVAQNNIPFANKPVKTAYMWRDIARRAGKYGLAPRLPAPYPIADLPLANQVALIGMREGWGSAYVRETYRLWFEEGEVAGAEPNLSRAIAAAGQEPEGVLARAAGEEAVAALAQETERAMALGIFGSPSFVVDGEVFWGDDRLDDAISWARDGRVR